MDWFYYYLVAINLIGFFIMGRDKQLAKKRQWRISEATLWTIAFVGGAIGATIGMNYFRHKTKHAAFKLGFPILAIIQVALLIVSR